MKKIAYILFFLSSFLFVWNTDIVNRTEADDAFDYAYQVEHNGCDWLYHPHHMLYGAVAKDLYNGAKVLGYNGRAYPLLRLISAFCGAGAVLMFFRFCHRRFSLRPISSLLCSGLLLFSYGFWRYANEVEVIIPACFVMLCAMYVSVDSDTGRKKVVWGGILCGISVLFHILNVVPVFLAVPLFFLLDKNFRGVLIHMTAATGTVLVGYGLIYHMNADQIFAGHGPAAGFSLASIPKALVGFSQCVVSSNFMLWFEKVRNILVELFPSRMLLEEIYLGQSIPMWNGVAGIITISFLAIVFMILCGVGLRLLLGRGRIRRRERVAAKNGWRAVVVVAVWFLGYAGVLLLLEPGNPEVWVMGLIPFWLLFCGLIVAPVSNGNRLWLVLLLMMALLMHNFVGGMVPLKRLEGDYNFQKSAWIIQESSSDDLVLTAGSPVFERYLRYYYPGNVEYLYEWDGDMLAVGQVPQLENRQGRIFVLGDVFERDKSLCLRFPSKSDQIRNFAEQVKSKAGLVHEDEFGGVYVLQ